MSPAELELLKRYAASTAEGTANFAGIPRPEPLQVSLRAAGYLERINFTAARSVQQGCRLTQAAKSSLSLSSRFVPSSQSCANGFCYACNK